MRVKPLGRVVLFLLFLGGMYALWIRLPASFRQWDPVALKDRIPVPDLKPVTGDADTPVADPHPGWAIGFAGTPPPALVDVTQTDRPAPALAATLGEDIVLVRESGPNQLLEGLRGGALDAAVLDFPSVVYASTDEKTTLPGDSSGRMAFGIRRAGRARIRSVETGNANRLRGRLVRRIHCAPRLAERRP